MIGMISSMLRPVSFRGKARLLHAACPKEGEREALIFGYSIRLDLGDFGQRSIYLGVYEPRESASVRAYLKKGMTVIDVGANVGYYSLMAASIVRGEGQVHAFEPSPYAFARLSETIARNDIQQLRLVGAALSDVAGQAQLFVSKKPGNHTPTMVPNDGGQPVGIRVMTLDNYLGENRIERVDFAKLDIEGFEPNVLRGASEALGSRRIRAILCEFNRGWLEANGSSAEQLYQMIVSRGFSAVGLVPDFRKENQNIFFTLN